MAIQLDLIREFVLKRVGYGVYFASFFIAIVVQFIQKRITNLIFIEPRTRFVAHHRAPFLHYWYFMMLTSMTRALTSYFLRVLKYLLRYPMYSLRVDRNAETWSVRNEDAGKIIDYFIEDIYQFFSLRIYRLLWHGTLIFEGGGVKKKRRTLS